MSEDRLKARWLKEDNAQIDSMIVAMIGHPEGRRTLWWLLSLGRIGQQPFAGNALNTSFNCGMLDVGNQILARITSVSPEGYVTMMKEMADERTRRDNALADARASAKSDAGADTDSDTSAD